MLRLGARSDRLSDDGQRSHRLPPDTGHKALWLCPVSILQRLRNTVTLLTQGDHHKTVTRPSDYFVCVADHRFRSAFQNTGVF